MSESLARWTRVSKRAEPKVSEVPEVLNRVTRKRVEPKVSEVPEVLNRVTRKRAEPKVPTIPEVPNQVTRKRAEPKVPTIPEVPNQVTRKRAEPKVPTIPEVPNQVTRKRAEPKVPTIPEVPNQVTRKRAVPKVPKIPEVPNHVTRKRAEVKVPEVSKPPAKEQEFKDPSPYLKKYRGKTNEIAKKKPMEQSIKQLTLNFDCSLDHSGMPPPSPKSTKPKYRILNVKKAVNGYSKADKPRTDKNVDMLQNLMKDISNKKFNHSPGYLDKLLSQGSEMNKHANKKLKPLEVEEKETPSTCVNVDVFKLIAEKLSPHQETNQNLQFSEDFAFFEKYLDKSVTEMTILSSIDSPVRRLQVSYVRLLMNYIENVSPQADSEQFCLSTDLVFLASKYNGSSSLQFSPDDLFPPFYYAVQRLVKVYTNWEEELPWLFDESRPAPSASLGDYDNDDEEGKLETQAARLRRRVESVWSSLLTITLQLLQRSKLSCKMLPFDCNTGTAFLLVVLVAKSWYNLLFFNRLEPKLEDPVQTSQCWNLIVDFGRCICALYLDEVDISPLEEVIKLIYPFLLYAHQKEEVEKKDEKGNSQHCHLRFPPLLLSYEEVDSLLCQLVAMNPVGENQLQCAYFQMAFTAMHYHLVWEQLMKLESKGLLLTTDCDRILKPYQCLSTDLYGRVFTSWEAVYDMMVTTQPVPFTEISGKEEQRELFWYEAKPPLVLKLLLTLSTIAQKFIITEYVGQTRVAEYKHLRNVTGYFETLFSQSQFMSRSILESINRMIA